MHLEGKTRGRNGQKYNPLVIPRCFSKNEITDGARGNNVRPRKVKAGIWKQKEIVSTLHIARRNSIASWKEEKLLQHK